MVLIHVDSESSLKAGGLCGDLFIPVDGEINEKEQLKCLQSFSQFSYQYLEEGKTTIEVIIWLLN